LVYQSVGRGKSGRKAFHLHIRPSPILILSISTMLWQYRVDIDNWLPIHFYMYVRCRYRQCCQCDNMKSISTVDFPCISTCKYCVHVVLWRYRVNIDNWLFIHFCMYAQCWYRQYCNDIVLISTYRISHSKNLLKVECYYFIDLWAHRE
jgi:hypothetical protein